jgi:hypothetical protein
VPIEQTRRFTTFKDYQESVDIRVYQGESRDIQENELLGQFMFSGFEKARRGEVSIDITFEINADGIVDVEAKDLSTGKQASTRITLSAGLSEGDIENIIQSGRTGRVASTPAQPTQDAQPADRDEKLAPEEGTREQAARSDEKLTPKEGTLEQAARSDEKLAPDEGIFDEAILDAEVLGAGTPNEKMLDAAKEIVADQVPQPVAVAEPKTESVKPEPALRPIEMDDLITDEIEILPSLTDDDLLPESDDLLPESDDLPPESDDLLPESDDLLPESDDLLELEGLEDVKLTPAAIEPAPGGKITAIDEDLTTTTPTIDEPEAAELENDLFERPGTDLSELDDDETKA